MCLFAIDETTQTCNEWFCIELVLSLLEYEQ
jgi:hypothetical protein